MANIGEGLQSPAIEQDPSIAQLQSQQLGAQQALAAKLPATGFVASIDGLTGLLNFNNGTNISVTNDGVNNFTFSIVGLSAAATAKSQIDTVSPNAGNDSTQGFNQFSLWLNTTTPAIFMCASAAVGSAVWLQISN